ncbi:hypothetical protein ALC56_07787 [Trachymyrmex septentrionalis]|uniref:Uncharacterized protein n=1 Tax=Trachymyrmex septentrionalis TaxID=34720 RepID=A0A195FAY0_9HYME|nr:hypothetical protein ALC56_07787 [Trachymyrmex septentrionalis]
MKKDDKKIVNLFSRNPGLTLRQGQAKLKQKGLDISYENDTIRTYLKANNMNSTTLLLDLLYIDENSTFVLVENLSSRYTKRMIFFFGERKICWT